MSAAEPIGPDEEGPDVVAGEYVLGVLDPADHQAAARRMRRDPEFAAAVEFWEGRLSPLIAQVPPIEPPTWLWPSIAGRLYPNGEVVQLAPRNLWRSLPVWRAAAGIAASVAAACLVLVLLPKEQPAPPPPPPAPAPQPGPVAVARLEPPKGGAAFVATLDEDRHRLIVTPLGPPVPANRSAELWLMPADAPPVPLGVFMGEASLVAPVPDGVEPGAQLGVSLEPYGGSPTGAPTGPVLATGVLMRL